MGRVQFKPAYPEDLNLLPLRSAGDLLCASVVDGDCEDINKPVISCPFWQYSDPYLSPYFMPSQELAFGPILYLQIRFGPQDATSDPSPPAYYFHISGLSLLLFPLVPPTRRLNHPISTLSLTRSFQAPPPLFNLDFQCPDFCLSVATHNFLFWTDQFSRSLRLMPFLFPRHDFPMSIPPS